MSSVVPSSEHAETSLAAVSHNLVSADGTVSEASELVNVAHRMPRARLIAASFAVAAFLAVVATLATRASITTTGEPEMVELLAETKLTKLQIAERMKMECSLAGKVNCAASKCCRDFGYQCFARNSTWASCLKNCTPATTKKVANGTWTCEALGEKTRCAKEGENCLLMGCCADVGSQCYAKNSKWGTCLKTCNKDTLTKYDPNHESWSCDPIGIRNTADYRNDQIAPGFVEVEPWIKNCSHIGENCMTTKCCSYSGYKCYQQNEKWASCLQKCFPGKWNGGINDKPMLQPGKPLSNPPPHWNMTFSMAPPGPWTCKRLSQPMKAGKRVGTSLFCFTVALTSNGGKKASFELDILKEAQKKYAHIFACDHWTVYSDVEVALNPGKTFAVEYPKVQRRPNTKNWVNLPLFLTIWKMIRQQTTWKSYPWIVKSDPSAVFIPQRLREVLKVQHVTQNGIFLENCKDTRMSFHGSLEVMSNTAFGTFLDHIEDCLDVLPWQNASYAHFRYYGEDKFLAWCMQAYGVDKLPSYQMVETVPKDQPIKGLHITVSCPSHRSPFELQMKKWHPNCTRVKTPSIHSFRTVKKWVECWENTTATS